MRFCVLLLLAAALGAIAALWTWTLPARSDLNRGPAVADMVLLDNGFHVDLALPREALRSRPGPLAEAVDALPPGDWVLIGWGDAVFYVDRSPIHHRLPDGARAFFRPGNPSVLMLDPRWGEPGRGTSAARVRRLPLTAPALEAVRARVEATLDAPDGRPVLKTAVAGDDARFWAARGNFWILNLCNVWAARTLNAAGLPVRPLRSVVSPEVLAAVDRAQLDRPPARD